MRVYRRHFCDDRGRFCNKGLRPWLRERGVDWQRFLREGVDAAYLLSVAQGDIRIQRVVKNAEEEHGKV